MYQEIFRQIQQRGVLRCATALTGPYVGSKLLYGEAFEQRLGEATASYWDDARIALLETNETRLLSIGDDQFLVELFMENPHMVICGGGHVSQPVCKVAKMLGFHVTVADDREEFLTRDRFPESDELIQLDFREFADRIPVYDNTYYVVVTRGHSFDELCARQILKRSYTYFGMIGSRSKVAATVEHLRRDGYSEEKIASMHAPIGIKLGGQTPEEIMISIMAEVVQVKNQHYCAYVNPGIAEAVSKNSHGVMATIIRKEGSSPRGVGSKMWVPYGGKPVGTIGGGSVEYRAIQDAARVNGVTIQEYDLSSADSSKLGMICGGQVEVLFETMG